MEQHRAAAKLPPIPTQMVWVAGANDSEETIIKGRRYRALQRHDGVTVAVTVEDRQLDTQDYLRKTAVQVVVFNYTNAPLTFSPENISLYRFDKQKALKLEAAKKIYDGFRTRMAVAAALGNAAASMQQQQNTTYSSGSIVDSRGRQVGTYSGTGSTSSPDYAAQRRAAQQGAVWQSNASLTAANMEAMELKAHTLSEGEMHTGYLFFERVKACPSAFFKLSVAGTEFQFPVSW